MAEENSKPGDKEESGSASQPKFRQIRSGKEHAIVINGQQVVLFKAPKKVGAKSEVVLPGYHLSVYDRVYLRVKQNRFSPVNLHRAYADSDPIVFSVPDFGNFLKEGDAVWVELVSTKNPEASGYLFPYVLYSLKGEGDGEGAEQEKTKKKAGKKGQGGEEEGTSKGLGFAGLAVAAAGEVMTGLIKPGSGAGDQGIQAESVKDKLKKALEKGDRNDLKEAIDEAKKNHDIESLREMYKEASGDDERALFQDALGISDFRPKMVPEEDSSDVPEYEPLKEEFEDTRPEVTPSLGSDIGTVVAGLGAVSQSSTIEGTAVKSGKVSGKQTVEAERTTKVSRTDSGVSQTVEAEVSESESGVSGQVATKNQTETSAGVQAQQSVSSRRSVSGSTGGGEVRGKTSATSETETQQQTEDSIKARVQGGGGSVASSGTAESSVKAKLKETVQGGGAEAEMEEEIESPAPQGQPARVAGQAPAAAKPAQGGTGRTVVAGVSAGQAPAAAEGARVQGSLESKVSGTAQYEVSPVGQGSTAKLGVEVQPGMPGVRIDAATLKTPFKGAVGKPEAEAKPAEQAPAEAQAPSGGKVGIGLKEEETAQAQEEQKPEKPSTEEEALAQISPAARQAALSFEAKASAQIKKMPGVAGPSPKKDRKAQEAEVEFRPGRPGEPAPQAGEKLGRPGEDKEAPEGGGEETAEGDQPQAGQKKPGGIAREKVAAGAAEQVGKSGIAGGLAIPGSMQGAGEQPEDQPPAPADEPLSAGEEEQPQEEKEAKPENEEPQNEQAAGEEEQQQNALSQALSDRLDKLAEDKKLDAEIQQVTKEANLVLDQVLMEGVVWVWGAGIPSFGLSVLLGALIGDFLWAFKNSIITGVLRPLLKTEALKKKGEEIAKQIKVSAKVKLNIAAMNLIVAAAVMLVILSAFIFLWIGCNYPPVIGNAVMRLAGAGAVCDALDNATSGFSFGGGDSGGGGASGSWGGSCQPLTSGPASVQNLSSTCFGSNASKASAIAGAESGGDAFRPSGVDKCTVDGAVVSWGLFQINISAQNNFAGLNCRSAFDKMYTAQTKNCQVVNRPLYDLCVAAAKDAQKNIQKACQMSDNGTKWSAWGANKKCGF